MARVVNQRFTGNGMINPGGGSDLAKSASKGARNPIRQVFDAFKNMAAKRAADADQMQNESAKMLGERNYYMNSPSKTKGALARKMGPR